MKATNLTFLSRYALTGAFLLFFTTGQVLADENGNDGNGRLPVNTNGSFEDADLGPVEDFEGIAGWLFELGSGADADFEIVDDPVQDGEQALKIVVNTVGSDAWNIQVVGDSIPVESGARYEFSTWAKAEEAGVAAAFTVGNYAFSEYGALRDNVTLSTDWEVFSFEFTITDSETVIRAPIHFSFSGNEGIPIYLDNLRIVEIEEAPARRRPVLVDIIDGELGNDFATSYEVVGEDTLHYVTITNDGWDIADPADPDWSNIWSKPISEEHIITLEVTFPYAGEYNLFMHGRVGPQDADDDSFFYPVEFGERNPEDADEWVIANQLDVGGYSVPGDFVTGAGAEGSGIWKWLNISEGDFHEDGITFNVASDDTTLAFQIAGRETDFDMHRIAFGRSNLFYTVEMLNNGDPGLAAIPDDPIVIHPGPPLAERMDKFLGNIYAPAQLTDFENYWNQVTPENASKWGSVEGTRGEYNWSTLDAAYNLAKDNDWPFRFHVLVWGNQQPGWMPDLADQPDEQLNAIQSWFEAVAERYPDIDYLEVVNEPLHDPPDEDPDNAGAGNYIEALGGTGDTGWDWVITAFEMAREIFPESTMLMINEYNIVNNMSNAQNYRELIELLQERDLIDVIGVQGHAFSTRTSAATMTEVLDYLAETGLPIQVTEMDVDGNPTQSPNVTQEQSDQNQLDYMQVAFPTFWEHPAVIGITFWGWRPGLWRQNQEAYLVRNNGEERPAMQWLIEYMENYPTSAGETIADQKPEEFRLMHNYPNPFNPATVITYQLSEDSNVRLEVYDMLGRRVTSLVNEYMPAGTHKVTFDGSNLASGVYLYRIQAGTFTDVKRMMLVK